MHYMGGKSKLGSSIAEVINHHISTKNINTYLEPFVGALWVLQNVRAPNRTASDANYPLITLYKAIQEGWEPPDEVSEETYNWYKEQAKYNYENVKDDPMLAFVGIGVSFYGKWFGGFARDKKGSNYAKRAKNSLLKKMKNCMDVKFYHGTFDQFNPKESVVYCDPPYSGTTSYDAIGYFDHEKFWLTMIHWANNNVVLVSEYSIPRWVNYSLPMSEEIGTDMHTKSGKDKRVENLYRIFPPGVTPDDDTNLNNNVYEKYFH